MFDGIPDLIRAGAFFAVLAIASVIAVGVSWLGYPTAALWIVGAGVAVGWLVTAASRRIF